MILKRDKYVYLIFAILSLSVVKWFSGWHYIYQIDSIFFLNPIRWVQNLFYFWRDSYTLGISLPGFNGIPFYLFQIFIFKISNLFLDDWNSLVFSQFLIYYLNVFLSFVFIYIYLREIVKTFFSFNDNLYLQIALVISSVVYVLNPLTISMIFGRYMTWAPFWAALPLLAYLYLFYLKTANVKYIIFSGFIFLTPLGIGFAPAGLVNLFLVYILLAVVFSFHCSVSITFKRLFQFQFLFLLLIAWAVLPQIIQVSSISSFLIPRDNLSLSNLLEVASRHTTLLNILRFMGYYLVHCVYLDSYPFSWAGGYLHNKIVLFSLFVYPVIFTLPFFLASSRFDKKAMLSYLFFSLTFVFFPLVMKGLASPFSFLGKLLLALHPFFFRHPYDRFASFFVFLYVCILLFVLFNLFLFFSNNKQKLFFLLFICLLFLFPAYPFFLKKMVHPSDRIDLSATSYMSLNNELSSLLSLRYRVLVVPFSLTGTYSYNIEGTVNHVSLKSFIYEFLPYQTVLQFPLSLPDRIFFSVLVEEILSYRYDWFVKILRLMNIRYIVLHKDFSLKYEVNFNYKKIAPLMVSFIEVLSKKKFLKKIYENSNIKLYEVVGNDFGDLFGISPLLTDSLSALAILADFYSPINSANFFGVIKNFKKINPTLWKVKVSAHRPFMLSFAEAYDPLWEARVYKDGKKVKTVRSIPLYSVINGFWIDETGDLEIVLRYKSQDWFERGLVVSILTFLACVGYLLYDWRKKS